MLLCQQAVKAGDLALVQAHVRQHGVGLQGKNGFQALHFAACYGRTEIAEYLLGILAPVNAQTTRGNTPLHIACFESGVPMIELLVDHGADTSVLNWQVRSSKVLQNLARFDQQSADCCAPPPPSPSASGQDTGGYGAASAYVAEACARALQAIGWNAFRPLGSNVAALLSDFRTLLRGSRD